MLLKGALNGARQPGSHPALPTTPEAFAEAARGAVGSGAGAIHVTFVTSLAPRACA